MWIYITHVTGLKIFKMSRQNPRSCQDIQDPRSYQDFQDPRSCQDIQNEIQDLNQEIQDVKIKHKIFPRYSRVQDFSEILAKYSSAGMGSENLIYKVLSQIIKRFKYPDQNS